MSFNKDVVGHWIRIGAEYVAVVLLFAHLLPEHLLEKWKENGLAAIVLLGLSTILALIFRYKSETQFQKEINQKELAIASLEVEKKQQSDLWGHEKKELDRLAVYGKVFPILNKAFSQLHDTMRSDLSEIEFRQYFKDFTTQLSDAFEMVTGTKCHVCIKIPVRSQKNVAKANKLKAVTLVRDVISVSRDNIDSVKIDHFFNLNTDFEYIFHNINSENGRFFFSNNLAELQNYKNTSFLAKGLSNPYFHEKATLEEKEKDWPLRYRASITSPICPGIADQRNAGTLFGFLCVDCEKKDQFNVDIDPEIVAGCADGLYNPLKRFIEKFYL